jgi:predicted ferric reductase
MSALRTSLLTATFAACVLAEGPAGAAGASGGGATTGGGGGGGGGGAHGPIGTIYVDNVRFAHYTTICMAAIVVAVAIYQLSLNSTRYIRTLTCLNNETQKYFQAPNTYYAMLKQHLVYAPLFRTRHHNELRLFKGWGVGILPTRFQSLFLTGIIALNVVLCAYGIEWDDPMSTNTLKHLRNRTGTLSVLNMIPLVVMAGRNNPLISALGLSFDTFNLVHRWFGRICAAEALAHTVAHMVNAINKGGWASFGASIGGSTVILTGVVAMAAFVVIMVQAMAVVRHTFYEFFLHFHITLVVASIVALWYHLGESPAQLQYLQGAIGCWAAERAIRIIILVYRNAGNGGTKAVVESLPGDALRVTLTMSRPWSFRPGQYMFLTVPSIGLWTSHPFSLAWSDDALATPPSTPEAIDAEKGLSIRQAEILSVNKTTMSAIVRRRDGFTHNLFKKCEASPDGRIVIKAWAEGPYGGLARLNSYGTVLLFAGGVGITHQVPFVRELVTGFANGTTAARRVLLVWTIQSPEHLEWIRPWMSQILALDKRRDILRIQLFVTRPRSTREIQSPSATVQMFPGRPNVETLIGIECENMVGAMGVSVCGTGGLADDVRRAVRTRQSKFNIDLSEESFSW